MLSIFKSNHNLQIFGKGSSATDDTRLCLAALDCSQNPPQHTQQKKKGTRRKLREAKFLQNFTPTWKMEQTFLYRLMEEKIGQHFSKNRSKILAQYIHKKANFYCWLDIFLLVTVGTYVIMSCLEKPRAMPISFEQDLAKTSLTSDRQEFPTSYIGIVSPTIQKHQIKCEVKIYSGCQFCLKLLTRGSAQNISCKLFGCGLWVCWQVGGKVRGW